MNKHSKNAYTKVWLTLQKKPTEQNSIMITMNIL